MAKKQRNEWTPPPGVVEEILAIASESKQMRAAYAVVSLVPVGQERIARLIREIGIESPEKASQAIGWGLMQSRLVRGDGRMAQGAMLTLARRMAHVVANVFSSRLEHYEKLKQDISARAAEASEDLGGFARVNVHTPELDDLIASSRDSAAIPPVVSDINWAPIHGLHPDIDKALESFVITDADIKAQIPQVLGGAAA